MIVTLEYGANGTGRRRGVQITVCSRSAGSEADSEPEAPTWPRSAYTVASAPRPSQTGPYIIMMYRVNGKHAAGHVHKVVDTPARSRVNTPSMTTAVLRILEQAITNAGGVRALARQWGISPAHVCNLRLGKREPSPAILARLGLRRRRIDRFEPIRDAGARIRSGRP